MRRGRKGERIAEEGTSRATPQTPRGAPWAPCDPNRSGRPGGICRAGAPARHTRGEYGANAMVLAVLRGAPGFKTGGTRRMLYLAPAIGLAYTFGLVLVIAPPGQVASEAESVVSKSLPVSAFSLSVWSSSTRRAGGWPSITLNPNSPLRTDSDTRGLVECGGTHGTGRATTIRLRLYPPRSGRNSPAQVINTSRGGPPMPKTCASSTRSVRGTWCTVVIL